MAWGIALAGATPADAQAPVGGQFQVNTYTTSHQDEPAVALAPGGSFLVVWDHRVFSNFVQIADGIRAQRYASDGSPAGVEFQVESYTTGEQRYPAVAADSDGDFIVVWRSDGSFGSDTSATSIQGRRYASNGSPLGAEFQVNTYTTSGQTAPSVAAAPDGDFVVVWASYGSAGSLSVQAQRFASDGAPQGAQFQVNDYTMGDGEYGNSVAMASDGSFIVAWTSYYSPGTDSDFLSIQGRRFDSAGAAQGSQFQVNNYTTTSQSHPSVSAAADGDFVVTWSTGGAAGSDPISGSVQGQRFASDGSLRGAQFQVNTYTTGSQASSSVASEADGDFVVTWRSEGSFGSDTLLGSIQGQRYASNGLPRGTEFQINTYTTFEQSLPAVASGPLGNLVVVWQSNGSPGTDTSITSAQGQRFSALAAVVPSLSSAGIVAVTILMLLGATRSLWRRS
jgi:hypothetical protein